MSARLYQAGWLSLVVGEITLQFLVYRTELIHANVLV